MKKLEEGQKHSKEHRLVASKEDLRWATNELVADWRAERLKCDRIADVGCGIGLQAMSFAKKCSSVIAIDIDGEKIKNAKANAKKLNFKNIDFLEGDALAPAVHEKAKGCQAVFLDPERSPTAEARDIDGMKPDIKEFLTWYSDITSNIAIEFPPQIQDLPLDCEREYASVDGKLNRLTLYFGGLKKCERSAVALPAGESIQKGKGAIVRAAEIGRYVYEADHAVQKAGLIGELTALTGAGVIHEGKYVFLTSRELVRSAFFKASYRVLDTCKFDLDRMRESLKKNGAEKALIRYEVSPEEYWNERNRLEHGLDGDKQLVVFNFNGVAVICDKA